MRQLALSSCLRFELNVSTYLEPSEHIKVTVAAAATVAAVAAATAANAAATATAAAAAAVLPGLQ